MVSDIPGTTRDAIDTLFTDTDGTRFNIIDTAGMRKKKAVEDETLERYSVLRSIAAIDRCDVALLLIDAQTGVTEQDTKVAGLILNSGKAVIVVVNKWDAIEKDTNTMEAMPQEDPLRSEVHELRAGAVPLRPDRPAGEYCAGRGESRLCPVLQTGAHRRSE